MTSIKFPVQITEVPHRGSPRIWVLESENHLNEILNSSQTCRTDCTAQNVDEYLDWLRSDLRQLIVEEAE